jgi:hypothetical protein
MSELNFIIVTLFFKVCFISEVKWRKPIDFAAKECQAMMKYISLRGNLAK